MLEILVNLENNDKKTVMLVENGKLLEKYEGNLKDNRTEENIYIGTVKDIVSGMQAAFVDIGTEKKAFIHVKEVLPKKNELKEKSISKNLDIKEYLRPNQKILVQVKKDSTSNKGARISTHISLTSRYIVFMPETDIITISQKIQNEEEKKRLLKIAEENTPKGNGLIIRTSAEKVSKEEIIKDIEKTYKKWQKIQEKYKSQNTKENLIYTSPKIDEKMVLDLLDKGLNKITVNNKKDFENISQILKEHEIGENVIQLVLKENANLLETYELESQLEKLQNRKIWLNCGGFITIDKTEALTAIDVNTGKFTGSKNLEETVYKVNSEATREIVKQLRLRDIGGIIIIDYIDMQEEENKEKIKDLLEKELRKDRAKTQVEGFTKLNLMELTRKHICSE